jgi:8-oxo-dGTP pyrophosphatase MutT (NUDIX family)
MSLYVVKPNGEVEAPKTEKPTVECAGGVIWLGRGMIVLVRPLNGRNEWLLPKGHIEKGETAAQAAIREVLEETGAVCTPDSLEPIAVTTHQTDKEIKETTWYSLRAAALKTEKAELVVEMGLTHREIGIFPAAVALTRLTYEEHREVLCQALGNALDPQ